MRLLYEVYFGTRHTKAMNRLRLSVTVLLIVFATVWVPVEGGDPGEDYLNGMERQVTLLKIQVEANYRNKCDLLGSCGPANCSRNSCWPLMDDVKRTSCLEVKNNSICPAAPSTGFCPSKKFDFTKPYVRLAPTTDITALETATTICSQRELSSVFQSISSNSSFLSRAFMGSVEGTYIHFPGSDQSANDCKPPTYDCRPRPWYQASTSVAKAVMVLLDVGVSMGNPIPPPLQGTYFTTARNIVLEMLYTLSPQDVVNIVAYDSSTAFSLAPSPVRVLLQNTGNSSDHPEFDHGLLGNLSSLNLESLKTGPSNISKGIEEALRNYDALGAGISKAMKIIIVFTDGNAASLKDGALASVQNMNGTKIFIFKLPQADDVPPNRFLTGTPFLAQLRSMGGSFNVLGDEAGNPLYSIRAYFSFLANFRKDLKGDAGAADYSIVYKDFEGIVDNIFSISKPAFDDDGNLLGVVGLNVFVDKLGTLTDSVRKALTPRTQEKVFDPSTIVLTAANASIQVDNNAVLSCTTALPPANAGLCPSTDRDRSIEELACCNACRAATPSKNSKTMVVGISAGVAAAVVVVFIVGLLYYRRSPAEPEPNKFVFPLDKKQCPENNPSDVPEATTSQNGGGDQRTQI